MDKIPAGAWVVVADGESARIFRNAGDSRTLLLQFLDQVEPTKTGGQGPSGSAPPEQTGQQTREATFAKQLAKHLNDAALKNEYARLLLVADPQTLGQVRPQLHKQTQQKLIGEVVKTLTNAPLEDIELALS